MRPGRVHDQTSAKTQGIKALLDQHPTVEEVVDEGYRGLAKRFPDQVCAPPPKPPKHARPGGGHRTEAGRMRQSSRRICVEHGIAEHKQWRPVQRYTRRREYYAETYLAVAGLVSDRAAGC